MGHPKKLDDLSFDPMPIKIEISIPEARKALVQFSNNRIAAFRALTQSARNAVACAINELLETEITLFLGQDEQHSNKRNGYRERHYHFKGIGGLKLRVPRDRKGQFESVVVKSHERMDPRLREDMAALHLAGISQRMLSMLSQRILGVNVSKIATHEALKHVQEQARQWLTRPLQEPCWALYVDGTNFRIQRRGSTEKEPALVVLGVLEGSNRHTILSIEPGQRDNAECWRSVFKELKQRGLDASKVRIGIMDGLPGLEKVFREEFSNAVTARCWRHAVCNAMAKVPQRLQEPFKQLLDRVMYAKGESDARAAFEALKAAMSNDAQRAVACIEKDLDSLLVHYQFEPRFWRALRTTNAIERVNKEFKRRSKPMESMGERTQEIMLAFVALRLEMGWRRVSVDSKSMDNLMYVRATDDGENPVEKSLHLLVNKA